MCVCVCVCVCIDNFRVSLNKKTVRSLKACEHYLFDFDMYTCMNMYLVSLNFYTYLPWQLLFVVIYFYVYFYML